VDELEPTTPRDDVVIPLDELLRALVVCAAPELCLDEPAVLH
jgi:hypothetical protein